MDMQTIKLKDIIIGDRYRKDMGDIEGLALNITENGILQPIIVTKANKLIDGHRRIQALELLGETFAMVSVMDITQDDGIIRLEFDANEQRKQFTMSEKAQMLEVFKDINNIKAGGIGNNRYTVLECGAEDPNSKKNIEERKNEVARAVGFTNSSQAKRAKRVAKYCISEVVDKVDSGKVSLTFACEILSNLTKGEQLNWLSNPDLKPEKKTLDRKSNNIESEIEIAISSKKINQHKAEDIRRSIARNPSKYNSLTWVKHEINQHYIAICKSNAIAEANIRFKKIEDDRAFEKMDSILVSIENKSKSIRTLFVDYFGVSDLREAKKMLDSAFRYI